MKRTCALAVCGLLHLGSAAAWAAPPALGPLMQWTGTDFSCQRQPLPAVLGTGTLAVAWNDTRSVAQQILLRRMDALGRLNGPEPLAPKRQLVALGTDGLGAPRMILTDGTGLSLQRFTPAGLPLGGEVPLPTSTADHLGNVAFHTDGRFALVWQNGDRIQARWFDGAGMPAGAPFEVAQVGQLYAFPQAAVDTAGHLAVAWVRADLTEVDFRRFSAQGAALGPAAAAGIPAYRTAPAIAAGPDGSLLIARERTGTSGLFGTLFVRAFSAADQPLGPPVEAGPTDELGGSPRFATDGHGQAALVWRSYTAGAQLLFLRNGAAEGPAIALHPELPPDNGVYDNPVAVFLPDGRLATVWGSYWPPPFEPPACIDTGIYGRIVDPAPDASGDLRLQNGRFRLHVAWRTTTGWTGTGQPIRQTDDSGAFWFFAPDNPELMLKVLDGRGVNGAFWVFYATLTDVAFDLTVTDTATGKTRTYSKPQGRLESRADTGAFPAAAGADMTATAAATVEALQDALAEPPVQHLLSPAVCPMGSDPLCLAGEFSVGVRFTDPRTGQIANALGIPLTLDSGSFWFFTPDNLELFVKMVNGGAVNKHIWFFYGGLSTVDYDITVTDMGTGAQKVYRHRGGQLTSAADTSAF